MASLDLGFVRAQFPAFAEPALAGFAHFENAGGSYACGPVIAALERFYRQSKVQPYYPSAPSRAAGARMDEARARLAAWLNVAPEELHLGPSTTQNSYVIARALRGVLAPGDEVVVTSQDHEANIGAWRSLQDDGVVVREWCVDPDSGELDPAGLDALLGPRTRVVAFTHCSNVVGSLHPVQSLVERVHRAGAWAFVDGTAYCPHALPDLQALGADLYLFSLYKVYGPHLGVMQVRRELAEALPSQAHFFKAGQLAAKFTPAGPDHAQVAAVNGVIDYLELLARHHGLQDRPPAAQAAALGALFRAHESALLQPLLDFLAARPGVRLLGRRQAGERAPTVALTVRGRQPAALAAALGERGIGVGAGHFYAWRLLQALGIDPEQGVLRISFVHYTAADELQRLLAALDELLR